MPSDDVNQLLLYRLAEQERALKEALAEITKIKEKKESEIDKLGEKLTKDISDKLAAGDKRIGDLHASVTRFGTVVPIVLGGMGLTVTMTLGIGALIAIKNLHSEITNETQTWLNGDGTATVTRLAEKVTNDYLISPAGQNNIKDIVKEKTDPVLQKFLQEKEIQIIRTSASPVLADNTPTIVLSAETQKAIDVVKSQSDDQRSPDAWRALIYSYLGGKSYETALALTDRWLASSRQTPEYTAEALLLKGNVLLQAGRYQESLRTNDEVIRRFGTDPALNLRKKVASALINKGMTLGAMGEYQAAIAVYDDVNLLYTDEPEMDEQISVALNNKASVLTLLSPSQNESVIAIYNEIIHRFGSDPSLFVRENVARALNSKASQLISLSPPQTESALATYDEVIQRFQDNPASILRVQVALAFRDKAILFERSNNQRGQAKSGYEDYLRRFANAPEPAIQAITVQVRSRLAALK